MNGCLEIYKNVSLPINFKLFVLTKTITFKEIMTERASIMTSDPNSASGTFDSDGNRFTETRVKKY